MTINEFFILLTINLAIIAIAAYAYYRWRNNRWPSEKELAAYATIVVAAIEYRYTNNAVAADARLEKAMTMLIEAYPALGSNRRAARLLIESALYMLKHTNLQSLEQALADRYGQYAIRAVTAIRQMTAKQIAPSAARNVMDAIADLLTHYPELNKYTEKAPAYIEATTFLINQAST